MYIYGYEAATGRIFLAVAISWPRQDYGDCAWGFGGDLRWSAADDRSQKRTFRSQICCESRRNRPLFFSNDIRYQPRSSPLSRPNSNWERVQSSYSQYIGRLSSFSQCRGLLSSLIQYRRLLSSYNQYRGLLSSYIQYRNLLSFWSTDVEE